MNETISDYAATYSLMTDEQLLNLAQDCESLLPEAALVFDAELAKRELGKEEIQEQAERVQRGQLEDAQRKPLAQTFSGFGTQLYGKRSFEPDGSFVTTLWVVLFCIPLIPLKSIRVKYVEESTVLFGGWSQFYFRINESRPDVRQVVNVYSFIITFFICANILDLIHVGSIDSYMALAALWACIPWSLRRLARRALASPTKSEAAPLP